MSVFTGPGEVAAITALLDAEMAAWNRDRDIRWFPGASIWIPGPESMFSMLHEVTWPWPRRVYDWQADGA